SIRETVVFSEQAEISVEEDKAEEYMRWTLEGLENIREHFKVALKTWLSLIKEQEKQAGKKGGKRLLTLKYKTARQRLEVANEIKNLNLTERALQKLIGAIRQVVDDIRSAERIIKRCTEKIAKKPAPKTKKELKAQIDAAKAVLAAIEDKYHLPVVEIKRSFHTISVGEFETNKAKRELVEANLRLVVSIAKKYTNRG